MSEQARQTEAEGEAPALADGGEAPRRRFRFPQITLALSAFIMSLAVTLIGAYYALQGPEILVRPPEQIILYRDGQGDSAILGFAIRLDMINGASDYGDVMLDANVSPRRGGVAFAYQSLVRPVFTENAQQAVEGCALGSRCIGLPGLLLIEQPDLLADLPGGAARAMYLSFPAAEWNCDGDRSRCAGYSTFGQAVRTLGTETLDLHIHMRFNSDGEREIRCSAPRFDSAYLAEIGWVSIPCESSSVTGEPFM